MRGRSNDRPAWGHGLRVLAIGAALLAGVRGTQDAVANGDTRTLTILHEHTKETASITFRRNGAYDQSALQQLNWLLRDWRIDEPTRMDPRLFDIVWEVYREIGAREPIHVVSAYRSPGTNAMLRRRSKAVAEVSQHMAGKAMDFYLTDVSMSRVREIGMRLQNGGVGFYPNSANSFVHLDAGSVRSWPRMTHDQLARLFPDGRTVHLPRDGKPMPNYELAKADILSKGGSVAGLTYADAGEGGERKSLWAMLFGGGGDDEDSEFYKSAASRGRGAAASRTRLAAAQMPTTMAANNSEDGGMRPSFAGAAPAPAPVRPQPRIEVAARAPAPATTTPATPAPSEPAPGFELFQPTRLAEPPTPPPPARPAELRLASVETTVGALVDVPHPPPRPEVGSVTVLAPIPPDRPAALAWFAGPALASAASGPVRGEMRAAAAARGITAPSLDDPRAALRALFETAASQTVPSRRAEVSTTRSRTEPVSEPLNLDAGGPRVRMQFSSASPTLVSPDGFSGPAVAPLPTLR